jgi:hypothetical protein
MATYSKVISKKLKESPITDRVIRKNSTPMNQSSEIIYGKSGPDGPNLRAHRALSSHTYHQIKSGD